MLTVPEYLAQPTSFAISTRLGLDDAGSFRSRGQVEVRLLQESRRAQAQHCLLLVEGSRLL